MSRHYDALRMRGEDIGCVPLEVRGHVCKFLRPLLRRETLSNGGSDGNGLARVLFPFSANFYTLPLGIVRELVGHRRRFCLLSEDPKWEVEILSTNFSRAVLLLDLNFANLFCTIVTIGGVCVFVFRVVQRV